MCAHKERRRDRGSRSALKRNVPMGYGGVVKLNGAFGDDTFSVSPRLFEHEGIRDDVNQNAFQLLQLGACSDPLRHIYTLRGAIGNTDQDHSPGVIGNTDQDLGRVGG